MCLGIPMEVIAIDGAVARCTAFGTEREASLLMFPESITIGDFVTVHLGYATRKVTADEARESWALFEQILATDTLPPTGR